MVVEAVEAAVVDASRAQSALAGPGSPNKKDMRTTTFLAALSVLVLLAFTGCGHKKQIPFDPGQMHELNLPRQSNVPPPAAGAAAPATAQAPAPSDQSPAAAQPTPAAEPSPGTLPPPSLGATAAAGTAASAASNTTVWPLVMTSENVTFQVHEPTLESWQDGVLIGRCLVIAQPPGKEPSVNGLVVIKGITEVDAAAGLVSLQDVKVKGTEFSAPAEKTQGWQEFLRFAVADKVKTVSLASLQSGQDAVKARQQAGAATDITPPNIIFSEKPAVLVYIDGDPIYVPVKGTPLTGVLNTRVILLKDAASVYYLRVYDGWVSSKSLQGPWKVASAPAGADKVEQKAIATGHANLLPGRPDAQGRNPVLSKGLPKIIVATQPTALIVLDGKPRFVAIPGTTLQFANNTSAHLFKDELNVNYVRIHGNWFRASALTGPWQYVPPANMPAAFAAIPNDHPKAKVKASLAAAGAQDNPASWNVVAADPNTAQLDYTMNGNPVIKPIRGTQLNFVANASVPIIQYDISSWYAVQNGIWFFATEATGPWKATNQVPPAIYAIPPTSPLYHAVHSRVISSNTDVVYYGYPTAGSLGPEGGAIGVEEQGSDYQYTPPSNVYWGWYY